MCTGGGRIASVYLTVAVAGCVFFLLSCSISLGRRGLVQRSAYNNRLYLSRPSRARCIFGGSANTPQHPSLPCKARNTFNNNLLVGLSGVRFSRTPFIAGKCVCTCLDSSLYCRVLGAKLCAVESCRMPGFPVGFLLLLSNGILRLN